MYTIKGNVMPQNIFPQNIKETEIGDNPYFNLFDMSMRFFTKTFTYHRDSYALGIYIVYHSRMPQTISNLCLGLPDRFKTNYHQFLIEDGTDSNQHPIYKYVDGPGFIHTFYYVSSSLYYCSGDELYLYFDNQSNYPSTIAFSNGDKLRFDSSGRLVRIENGFDSDNIKTITYNNQGRLSSIIDERKPLDSIGFTYTRQKLASINFWENLSFGNTSLLKKRINLSYSSSFLVGLSETPPVLIIGEPTERDIYHFSYNTDNSIPSSSFDRLEYIEDCLSHDVYKMIYSYINLYSDYLVTNLIKGYYDNNGYFVTKETIQRIGYSLRTDDWETTNEVSIIRKGIPYSYSMDKNAHITAVFDGLSSDEYSTLYKETGVYLPISGTTCTTFVNGHRFIRLTNSLSITFNNDAISLLNNYRRFVLRFYLKLNDYVSKRVVANISGTGIEASPTEINVNQFDRYQLVEVPINRNTNNISSLTITLSFINEDSDPVEVEIGDVYFDKKAITVLKFAGGLYSLNQVTSIGVYANYYDQQPTRTIPLTDELVFTPEDFLRIIKHRKNYFCVLYGNCFSPSKYPLYFNNGKVIDFYNFRFVLFVGNTAIFDSYNQGNVDLDSTDTWFFETIYPDRTILSTTKDTGTRVYYRFNDGNMIVTSRTGVLDDTNGFLTDSENIETFDWNEKLIETVKNKFQWTISPLQYSIISSCTTTYEYFDNGELKKAVSTNGNEIVTLYEAEENNSGYVFRKTSELNSVDISYNHIDCLESKITRNTVSGSSVINSLYSKQYSYDYFASDLSSVSFKYNNVAECTNTCSIDYDNSETIVSNGGSSYKLSYDIASDGVSFSVLNNNLYELIFSSIENNNDTQVTYFNASSNSSTLAYERNIYQKVTHQKLNSVNKVDYQYSTGIESYSTRNLHKTVDYFIDSNIGKETTFTYDSIDNSISLLEYGNVNSSPEFSIDYAYFTNGIIYTFGTISMSFISSVDETEIRIEDDDHFTRIYTFGIKKDDFDRLIKHHSIYSDVSYRAFISDITYVNGTFLPSSFTFGINDVSGLTILCPYYSESYNYDSYGNLSAIYIGGVSFPHLAFQYDGFGRIVEESNEYVTEYNRTYSYDSYGRLSTVGNNTLLYDTKGRLTSFGGTSLTYDNYGNRLTKGNDTYDWTRGYLLSQITKGNQTYQFAYDYQGRRNQKKIGSLTISYYYDGNILIGESRSDGKEIRYFYDETGIVGFNYYNGTNQTTYRYIKNPFNQIIGIINNQGTIEAKYLYDAWGNHKVVNEQNYEIIDLSSPGHVNPIRYKGYYYDAETGLYYLLSRYYDPSIMQFISPDEHQYLNSDNISGNHLYVYCSNNPMKFMDSTGRIPELAKWLIGGGVILLMGVGAFFAGGPLGVILGAGFYGALTCAAGSAIISGLIQGGVSTSNGGYFWEGFASGAADGFMWGAILGAATSTLTTILSYSTGTLEILGSAQKTGSLFHRFISNVQAGKFALQAGKYSTITLNKSLNASGLNGAMRPDVLAVGRHSVKAIEVVSKTQTIFNQTIKIENMILSNPTISGLAIDWIFGGWFF